MSLSTLVSFLRSTAYFGDTTERFQPLLATPHHCLVEHAHGPYTRRSGRTDFNYCCDIRCCCGYRFRLSSLNSGNLHFNLTPSIGSHDIRSHSVKRASINTKRVDDNGMKHSQYHLLTFFVAAVPILLCRLFFTPFSFLWTFNHHL